MEGAGGSPTGSQNGQMDGATIALRMVQAAEAAAAAATAVASRQDSGKDDWYKMLPKPGVFDPKDRESELSSFRDWCISMFCVRIWILPLVFQRSLQNNSVVERFCMVFLQVCCVTDL